MPLATAFSSFIAALAHLSLLMLDPVQRAEAPPFLCGGGAVSFWPVIMLNACMMSFHLLGLALGTGHLSSFLVCVFTLSEFIWAPLILGIFVGTWPVLLTLPGVLLVGVVLVYAMATSRSIAKQENSSCYICHCMRMHA